MAPLQFINTLRNPVLCKDPKGQMGTPSHTFTGLKHSMNCILIQNNNCLCLRSASVLILVSVTLICCQNGVSWYMREMSEAVVKSFTSVPFLIVECDRPPSEGEISATAAAVGVELASETTA